MEFMITICTNTEVLRSIWVDIVENNNYDSSLFLDDDIANLYIDNFTKKLNEYDIEYLYENKFSFWNGGPGKGHYHTETENYNDEILLSYNYAIEKARNYTQQIYEEFIS